MSSPLSAAYDDAAQAWRAGPARLYARLAAALLDAVPAPVEGSAVLDAGAGTGVAGAEALARGAARAVAVDRAAGMLAGSPGPAVVGDLARLPFGDGAFDLALAAFVLGHLDDPRSAAAELRRVAPALAASAFPVGWSHPAKVVVEQVLQRHGYREPAWYRSFKQGSEARTGDPDRLAGIARGAGFEAVEVRRLEVDGGLDVQEMVAWRLGMAHTASFAATLAPGRLTAVRAEAAAALEGAPPLVVPVLVLAAT